MYLISFQKKHNAIASRNKYQKRFKKNNLIKLQIVLFPDEIAHFFIFTFFPFSIAENSKMF